MSAEEVINGTSATEVPGTVYLVDIQHSRDETAHAEKKDILLIPQPLDTQRDPLSWSKWKKYWSLFLASLFACVMSWGENCNGASWTVVSADAHVTLEDMNGGSALNYLLLGFFNIIWIPTAMKYGRKFCYLLAMFLNLIAAVWNAYVMGTAQWYLSSLIGGLGTAAYEALIQLTVFDMFFAHERGTMLGVYIWTMQLGSILGLILGGYVAEGPGWRWANKITAILSGLVIILFLFTFDDSLFPRHVFRKTGSTEQSHSTPKATTTDPSPSALTNEKNIDDKANSSPASRQVSAGIGTVDLPPRTYLEQLNPVHYFPADKTRWMQYFVRPFQLFLFPNIIISGLIYAFGCTSGIVTFNTISEIMTDAPYNWSTGSTGLINLAGLLGSMIGMATAHVGDRLVIFLARRNGGYKEPEMRLWMLSVCFIYTAIGYFSYSWGATAGASWVCIAVGLCAMIAQQVAATSVATAYAMECFEGIAGELVVVLACCSSAINFAISFSVQSFIDVSSYGWSFTFFGICVLLSLCLAIPTMIWGKIWRKKWAPKYRKFIEEGVGFGMG